MLRRAPSSPSGLGYGVVAGWEVTERYSVSFQYNLATASFSDTDVDLSGFRIHFGWRWTLDDLE